MLAFSCKEQYEKIWNSSTFQYRLEIKLHMYFVYDCSAEEKCCEIVQSCTSQTFSWQGPAQGIILLARCLKSLLTKGTCLPKKKEKGQHGGQSACPSAGLYFIIIKSFHFLGLCLKHYIIFPVLAEVHGPHFKKQTILFLAI